MAARKNGGDVCEARICTGTQRVGRWRVGARILRREDEAVIVLWSGKVYALPPDKIRPSRKRRGYQMEEDGDA